MLGFYNYTTWLTYLGALCGVSGIWSVLEGHETLAVLFLAAAGFFDLFDGKVASTKKDRTEQMKKFGIQIDSLSDLICFCVLPATLLYQLAKATFPDVDRLWFCPLAVFYVLAGLIRLAYFNVTEEQRQKETEEVRKNYTGLPITASALIFPLFYSIVSVYCLCTEEITRFGRLFMQGNFRALLCVLMALTGILYITPFKMRKPRSRELWLILAVGLLVAAVLLLTHLRRLGVF